MGTLVLLRHGQAAFGTSHYDRLSELGLAQAQATGEYFVQQGWAFDRVWIGPRERHRLTAAAALSAVKSGPFELDARLDEFAEGEAVLASAQKRAGSAQPASAESSRQERLRRYMHEIECWAAGENLIEQVPPIQEFRGRIADWLALAADTGVSGQRILAVTSAGVIAVIAAEILRLPNTAVSQLISVIYNASVSSVVYSKRGRGLQSFNTSAHLPPGLVTGI